MDGLKINNVALFLGHIPTRKQLCFYFSEGTKLYPIGYVSKKNESVAIKLWGIMLNDKSIVQI
jgi:hypothetical protein